MMVGGGIGTIVIALLAYFLGLVTWFAAHLEPTVASWLHYLRQRRRGTAADEIVLERARRFLDLGFQPLVRPGARPPAPRPRLVVAYPLGLRPDFAPPLPASGADFVGAAAGALAGRATVAPSRRRASQPATVETS